MSRTSLRRVVTFVPFVLVGVGVVVFGRASVRTSASDGAASVQVGKRVFEQRCAICHATGQRAAQGPGLGGVLGRKAASARFGYSRALREAGLTWDRVTLDR